jgi:hypothetical protein
MIFITGILSSMILAKYTKSVFDVIMYALLPSGIFLVLFLHYEKKYITYEVTPITKEFEPKLFVYPIIFPNRSLDYCYVIRNDPIEEKIYIITRNKEAKSSQNQWFYNGKAVDYVAMLVINRKFNNPIIEPLSFV